MEQHEHCKKCLLIELYKQLEEDQKQLFGLYSLKQKQKFNFIKGKRGDLHLLYPN